MWIGEQTWKSTTSQKVNSSCRQSILTSKLDLKVISKKMLTKFQLFLQNLLNFPMEKEFFHTTQQYFRILGINLVKTPQKYRLNLQNLRTFFVFGLGSILSLCFTVNLAKTFEEYIVTFYVLSTMVICVLAFAYVFWKTENFKRSFTDIRQNMLERKFCKWFYQITLTHLWIKQNDWYSFRAWKFRIEGIVRRNWSIDRTNKQLDFNFICLHFTTDFYVTQNYFEYLCLFDDRFGKWCVWDALSYVVINNRETEISLFDLIWHFNQISNLNYVVLVYFQQNYVPRIA